MLPLGQEGGGLKGRATRALGDVDSVGYLPGTVCRAAVCNLISSLQQPGQGLLCLPVLMSKVEHKEVREGGQPVARFT